MGHWNGVDQWKVVQQVRRELWPANVRLKNKKHVESERIESLSG